jgi:hypothetical protein
MLNFLSIHHQHLQIGKNSLHYQEHSGNLQKKVVARAIISISMRGLLSQKLFLS